TSQGSYAHVQLNIPPGSTLQDLLAKLGMTTEERGFTFINGKLSAMPGIQTDLKRTLENGDRVAFFHLQSMWPFQYRHGISVTEEMNEELQKRKDKSLHHTYKK
ncbi:MAG: MoaD/ThiS family protein, partial [Deltaproteobacteria bacterium]|nr:MoaD/ThiS family protein [Deltaproteobacteria bacterium]